MSKLLPLKPLDKTGLKTILPCIDPPPPFKNNGFSSSVKDSSEQPNSFAPISLGNFKVPEAPKLSSVTKSSKSKESPDTKTYNFHKSYNSLMNQINTEKLEEESSEEESINPLIQAELQDEESINENPSNIPDPECLDLKNHVLKSRTPTVQDKVVKPNLDVLQTQDKVVKPKYDVLQTQDKVVKPKYDVLQLCLEDSEPLLRPKSSEFEDLDEELIETLKVTKKECKVFDYLDSNKSLNQKKLYSYSKIRENTDNLIFCIQDSIEPYKFYSYSKLEIYNQYSKCHTQMYFHLKIRTYDDLEIFWIPMIQITRLLEYSHPVYEIEKTKFTMNLYNLKPVRLSK